MPIRRAYAIRPYPDRRKTVTILIRSISYMLIRRAYAIRHYPDGRKIATILIHSASDMFIRGAYAIRPYPDGQKIVTISIHSVSYMFIRRAYAIRPYPDERKIATISIRLSYSNLKNAQILIHRQKMILKLIEIIYPWAIKKINPNAYTFLFVQTKKLCAA